MGLKEAFLNKGWAGRTLSRAETVERLNPLIRQHYELNHMYEDALRKLDDRESSEQLNLLQKTARADLGKLSETVLSAGGASYNGVDLDPSDFDAGTGDAEIFDTLQHLEGEFETALESELQLEHQIRTRAILGAVLGNSRARLTYVQRRSRNHR